MKAAASARRGPREKALDRRVRLDQPSAAQEKNLVRKPPRLTEIVCRHDDLGSTRMDLADDPFRSRAWRRGRGWPWARRGRGSRGRAPTHARARVSVVRLRREDAPADLRRALEPDRFDHVACARRSSPCARRPRRRARIRRWRAPSAAASRGAETPSPARDRRAALSLPCHSTRPEVGVEQAMAQPHRARSCPRRSGPRITVRGPRAISHDDAVDDRAPAGDETIRLRARAAAMRSSIAPDCAAILMI